MCPTGDILKRPTFNNCFKAWSCMCLWWFVGLGTFPLSFRCSLHHCYCLDENQAIVIHFNSIKMWTWLILISDNHWQVTIILWEWLSRILHVLLYMFSKRHPAEEVTSKGVFQYLVWEHHQIRHTRNTERMEMISCQWQCCNHSGHTSYGWGSWGWTDHQQCWG